MTPLHLFIEGVAISVAFTAALVCIIYMLAAP